MAISGNRAWYLYIYWANVGRANMKIFFVDELPQWITQTKIAIYYPHNHTIYVRRDRWHYVFHELTHWLGHKLGGWEHWIHYWLDCPYNFKKKRRII